MEAIQIPIFNIVCATDQNKNLVCASSHVSSIYIFASDRARMLLSNTVAIQ